MAIDITISLSDAKEAELNKLTAERNVVFPKNTITPTQFLRQYVRDFLDLSAQQRADAEKLGLRAAYKLATPAEQAQIDSILAKYR